MEYGVTLLLDHKYSLQKTRTMKHITTILAGLFCFALSSHAQIKKQYTQASDNHSTTVVIKDSKEVDDIQLLNDSFEIEDYAVGDIIYIGTEDEKEPTVLPQKQQKVKASKRTPKVKKAKRIGKGTRSTAFAKRKKRPNKKSYTFSNAPKKAKRPKWDKKCYTW